MINDNGAIVFTATRAGFTGNALFLSQNGAAPSLLYDTSGLFSSFLGDPFINNNGQVAFHALLDSGVAGIFVGSGGAVTTIADNTGVFSGFGINPSISEPAWSRSTPAMTPGGRESSGETARESRRW